MVSDGGCARLRLWRGYGGYYFNELFVVWLDLCCHNFPPGRSRVHGGDTPPTTTNGTRGGDDQGNGGVYQAAGPRNIEGSTATSIPSTLVSLASCSVLVCPVVFRTYSTLGGLFYLF